MNLITIDMDALARAIDSNTDATEQEARAIINTVRASAPAAPTQSAKEGEAEREAFEAAMALRSPGCDFNRFNKDNYSNRAVHNAWDGWQARSALASQQSAPTQSDAAPVEVRMWHDRIKDAHPRSEPEYWPSSLKAEYMEAEILELRAALASREEAPQQSDAAPVGWVAAVPAGDFEPWRQKLMELVRNLDSLRGGPSKSDAWHALWQHSMNAGPLWRTREYLAAAPHPQAMHPMPCRRVA